MMDESPASALGCSNPQENTEAESLEVKACKNIANFTSSVCFQSHLNCARPPSLGLLEWVFEDKWQGSGYFLWVDFNLMAFSILSEEEAI